MTASDFDLQATIARLFVYPDQVLRRRRAARGAADRNRPRVRPRLDGGRRRGRVRQPARAAAHGADPAADEAFRDGAARARHAGAAHRLRPRRRAGARAGLGRRGRGLRHGRHRGAVVQRLPLGAGQPQKLRLVRFDPEHQRLSSRSGPAASRRTNQFADGFPLLVASEGSLAELNARLAAAGHDAVGIERFRPNIVLAGIEAHDEDRVDTAAHHHRRGRGAAAAGQALRTLPDSRHRPGHGARAAPKSATRCAATAPMRASTAPSPSA